MTSRGSIARALWLTNPHCHPKEWPSAFAWHENELANANPRAAHDSLIGKCVAQAERVLRLLDAAGLEVREKEPL